jgi:hypothetical protein
MCLFSGPANLLRCGHNQSPLRTTLDAGCTLVAHQHRPFCGQEESVTSNNTRSATIAPLGSHAYLFPFAVDCTCGTRLHASRSLALQTDERAPFQGLAPLDADPTVNRVVLRAALKGAHVFTFTAPRAFGAIDLQEPHVIGPLVAHLEPGGRGRDAAKSKLCKFAGQRNAMA